MRHEDIATLGAIRQLTGVKIPLSQNQEIHTYQSAPLQILVSIRTYEVQETARETRFKKAGWKIYTLARASLDVTRWHIADVSMIPDSSFEPYAVRHYGRVDTPQEAQERRSFEDLCHRPGTTRHPLENLAVTEARALDSDVTRAMRRHWNV